VTVRFDDALRIQRGEVVSFIGAGGKTSALFRLGTELVDRGWRVLATTTTRVAEDELRLAHVSLPFRGVGDVGRISNALNSYRFVFLYDSIRDGKAFGVRPDTARLLLDRVNSDVLLIEADGARRLPFKAPYAHEPVIPSETTRAVLCVGMDAIGKPFDNEHVYNAEVIARRYGYPWGEPIMWPWLASVLRDDQLGLLNVPGDVPVDVLLNNTRVAGATRHRARLLAGLLLREPRIRAVVLGEMRAQGSPVSEVRRPVAAVVLAAGMSSRMGHFKVLLPWGKQTVLEAIIERLHRSRLDRVVVVTGREASRVGDIAAKSGVLAVHNDDFERGEMLSSLQVGVRALDERFDAALVVLGDQPQLQSYVATRVLNAYAERQRDIVIPSFLKRRGHPVLFSKRLWRALLDLPEGKSPRDLVNAAADEIEYVNVDTDSILQDIDTPEDYKLALRRAGLA
jgi:molybdenum cofactor cytidylyltransferase